MFAAVVGFIFGIVLGSFVKAAAGRIVTQESLWERSYCPKCKRKLSWYDLFPILSYIFLRGKCRTCQNKIPFSDLWAEVILGLITALLFYTVIPGDFLFAFSLSWQNAFILTDLFFKLFAIVVFSLIFLIDFKTGLIPNIITYPAAAFSLIYILFTTGVKSWVFYQELLNNPFGKYLMPPHSYYLQDGLTRIWLNVGWSALAALLATSFFVLLIIITRGKGMGWGDVKYVFFLGLVLGFPNIVIGLFLAFLIGAVFSLLLVCMKRKHFGQTIPFGPFLSLGALIALLWGPQILNWYLTSFTLGY